MTDPTPALLDATDLLDGVSARRLPEMIANRARELADCPVALYVPDLDGSCLLRLAGDGDALPERMEAALAIGPELAREALDAIGGLIARQATGSVTVPLLVRDRALGVLVSARAPAQPLGRFAAEAAIALELIAGYTDVVHSARRRKTINPAAEVQQDLLPPRIATLTGASVAGGVLPGYEVGGDFFDYADNPDGIWLAVGDGVGKGNVAASLAALAVGALRAARRSGATLTETAELMHATLLDLGDDARFLTAVLAHWYPADGALRWISCGHPPPLLVASDGGTRELTGSQTYPLGILEPERQFIVAQTTLAVGDRLVLYSDGISERRCAEGTLLGLEGIQRALSDCTSTTATATVRALQNLALGASDLPLKDDATLLVLAPE
jgi:serine phosphatase RsbU (regulator of sigma subunit)